jgi:hypothetical protein
MAARVGRSTWAIVAAAVVGASLLLAWSLTFGTGTAPSGTGEDLSEGRGGGNEVVEELSEQTEERLDALEQANADGVRWRVQTAAVAAAAPTPGWAGEQVADPATDDWEPAIAADPAAPYV